jgi:hypothetical protein
VLGLFIDLAALVLWFVIQSAMLISVNEGRYRKPVEGLVIVATLFSVGQRSNRFKKSSSTG